MRVPISVALLILFFACCVGAYLGAWVAGPMPALVHDSPEPERNYTLETLRALQPPPPVVRYESRYESPSGMTYLQGTSVATQNFYNVGDVRR
jgi:hypothetical protein